jgi:methyl-accepting chemotaxis protein
VSETATAASEVTSRITEVSTEAVETNRHAIAVGDNANGLVAAVSALKQGVIRAVRTSTTEVNRRRSDRLPVDLACRLSVPGQPAREARVGDISEGGACVRGGPVMAVGENGSLGFAGVGFPVPFRVRSRADDELHVAFALDAAAAVTFRTWLDRMAGPRQAA